MTTNNPRRGSQWARSTWKRALEGALISPLFDDGTMIISSDHNDGVLLNVQALDQEEDNTTGKNKQADQGLQFPPRQSVLTRLTALIVEMQHASTGLPTVIQSFKGICDTSSCQATCGMNAPCAKTGVPDAFMASTLIQWLTTTLDITSYGEACHLATMMCRMGFIFPCTTEWNASELSVGVQDDNVFYRYQTPYHWPSENLAATENDHACYLLSREMNPDFAPLDEYETKCLAHLEKMLSHQWGFSNRATAVKENLLQQCCITDQYIKRWQEYAFWKINRPQCHKRSAGGLNTESWNSCLRGLNRNLPSENPKPTVVSKKEKKKTLGASPSRILKSSCTRIYTVCTEWYIFDPFTIDDPMYYNPWKSDTVQGAWPIVPTEESGPYITQCKSWARNFDILLKDELGLNYFTEHLKKEFSEENLSFYLDCVYLRSAPQSEVEELIKNIFSEFISPNAATPINIDTQTMNQVKQEMKKNKTRYTFDMALEHIYKLMKKDSYKRFVNSNIYKDALANSKHPCKPPKEKIRLPKLILRIWRLSQFLPKNKPGDADVERGEMPTLGN